MKEVSFSMSNWIICKTTRYMNPVAFFNDGKKNGLSLPLIEDYLGRMVTLPQFKVQVVSPQKILIIGFRL